MLKKLLVAASLLTAVTSASAASILTQTAQGSYPSNSLGSSGWSEFTSMMNAQHTLSYVGDFSNPGQLAANTAVFVNQELLNTLSGAEATALGQYIQAGHKAVFIGENSSWDAWNASILSIVGGSFASDCNWSIGTPLVSNQLTAGLATVQNACGNTLGAAGGALNLFSNNMAALYSLGAGEALFALDSNFLDNTYINNENNRQFAANIVTWLGQPLIDNKVPEPASLALLASGLFGLVVARRRQKA